MTQVTRSLRLKLSRDDETPVRFALTALQQQLPSITYSMCNASWRIAEQTEGHAIAVMQGARLVHFGIGRVIELEEAGWSYVHG